MITQYGPWGTVWDYRHEDLAVPAPDLIPLRNAHEDAESQTGADNIHEKTSGNQTFGRTTSKTSRDDPGRTGIWTDSGQCPNAMCLYADTGGRVGTSCSPETAGQWPEISRLPRHFRGSIEHLCMVIWHKPCSFPDEQSNMWYAFNRLKSIALGQIFPHVWEDRMTCLGDWPASIQLLAVAYRGLDRAAIVEQYIHIIIQTNWVPFQYYAKYQIIAVNLKWNPLSLQNTPRMGLSEEMKDSFQYRDTPEKLPVFATLCQNQDIQIWPHQSETAAMMMGVQLVFYHAPKFPSPLKNSTEGTAGIVPWLRWRAAMDCSVREW